MIEQSEHLQVNRFIRRHPFLETSLVRYTTSERRSFERDIYDYARALGLFSSDARKEVLKGRAFCGEEDYNSDNTALEDEVDDSAEMMRRFSTLIVAARERSGSGQLMDVFAVAKEPKQHRRHKKQSTGEPLGSTKAQEDTMDIEVYPLHRGPSEATQKGRSSSKGISSKFFSTGHKPSKKRRRESADEDNPWVMKKPEKEAKKKKSKKVDGQATADDRVDKGVSSGHPVSRLEGYGKDDDILVDKHAATDNLVEGTKEADTKGIEGDLVADTKRRRKRKRKDRSIGAEAMAGAESMNPPEILGNVIITGKGFEDNRPPAVKSRSDHAVNEPLQEQQPSDLAEPALPNDESGDLAVKLKAIRATRKLKKQDKRRAAREQGRKATEKEDAVAVSPLVTKYTKINESNEDFDGHSINQITGLPPPSINELMGITSSRNGYSQRGTASAITHGADEAKSTAEAHRSFLISAERDSDKHAKSADIDDNPQVEQTWKSLDVVAELHALKDFSTKKQGELFDQGQCKYANKQIKDDAKEIKNDLQLEKGPEEKQVDVEHLRKKKRRKRKKKAEKEDAANDDDENVKSKEIKHPKNEDIPALREKGFQSPMIQ